MANNPFDQFDTQKPAPQAANPFDQFDAQQPASLPTVTVHAPARLPGILGDINDFGEDLGGAFVHHLGNIPVGLAQMGAHGLNQLVQEGSSTAPDGSIGRRIADYVASKTGAVDSAVASRESGYQENVPTNVASLTGATIGEVLPWLTGIGEARAAGLMPTASTALGRLGVLAGEGAAQALPQPVTGGGSYAGQKAAQVGIAAAAAPVAYAAGAGVGKTVSALRGVADHAVNPQAVADANIARLYGSDTQTIAALQSAPSYVPGEVPSAAQVLRTPEALQAERYLRTNAGSAPAFLNADNANNAARQSVVSRLAGNDATMQAAQQARRDAVQPYIDQSLTDSRPVVRWANAAQPFDAQLSKPMIRNDDYRTIAAAQKLVGKVKSGDIQEDDALQALKEMGDSVSQKYAPLFQRAQDAINKNMVDPTGVRNIVATIRNGPLGVDPQRRANLDAILSSIDGAKNINGQVGTDLLDSVRQNVAKALGKGSSQDAIAYGPAKDAITKAIERVSPGYSDYLAAYAKSSEPINTMQSVGKLADPNAPGSLNSAGDPQLAISRLRQVLRGDDMARYPMSDAARSDLDNVRQSLLRRSISDNKVGPSGSNTAADLQAQGGLANLVFGSNLSNKGGPLSRLIGGGIGGVLGSHFGPAGTAAGLSLGGGLADIVGAANGRVASRVGETAADSQKTAQAIQRHLQKSKKSQSKLGQLLLGGP
jgi:hypothetical protein